ncbi:MAG: T9SS type A sorting domain-containing protein [Sporocytophaga sp.]|nr:T9SS type A sorting domain-containing protein [Sporocytophaga sp.]
MKIIKLLMIMVLLCRYGQAIKAQDITVVINPTSGCNEGGIAATITANFVPVGHNCSWAINLTGFSLPYHDRTFSRFLTTGVYLFRCRYGGNIYSSALINVTTYGTIEEICGEYKQWPYWVAGNYITNCEDGTSVIIGDDEPGELYLKASNAITLLPGFTANTGTIVEARIAPVCSPNTESNVFSSLRKSVLNSYINETSNTSIFPNPSSGDFMLDLNFPESRNVDIAITDITGKEVYKNKLGFIDMASLDIDLSTEKPGLYLVKITSDSNTEFQKVVISK